MKTESENLAEAIRLLRKLYDCAERTDANIKLMLEIGDFLIDQKKKQCSDSDTD